MSVDDLIKRRKEGAEHPAQTDVITRVCYCGGVIYNRGKDENDDLIFETSCHSCRQKRQDRIRGKIDEINERMNKAHLEYLAKRLCSGCQSNKPLENARWCAPCIVKFNTPMLESRDDVEVAGAKWALAYAEKHRNE